MIMKEREDVKDLENFPKQNSQGTTLAIPYRIAFVAN
jgi:hypothetical protein